MARLSRLRGGRELPLLAARGRWAPLRLRGVRTPEISARRMVRVGEPPRKLSFQEQLPAPCPGGGYVLLETPGSECSVVVDGVAIPLGVSPPPRVTLVWWAEGTALDLTRENLVGTSLLRPLGDLLIDVLVEHSTPDSPWAGWVAAHPGKAQEARIFRMADGRAVTLQELQAMHARDGYLAVSRGALPPEAPWPREQVVQQTPAFQGTESSFGR